MNFSIDNEEILIQIERENSKQVAEEDDIKEHDVNRVVNIIRQFLQGIALSNVPHNNWQKFVIKGNVVLIGCRTESVV